jgi:hypothetical protein
MDVPFLLGIILGAILTVAGAFAYDNSTGRVGNGLSPTAGNNPPMVNWDVVNDNFHDFQARLRTMETDLQRGWKRLTG